MDTNKIVDVELIQAGLEKYDGEMYFTNDNTVGSHFSSEPTDTKISVRRLSHYLATPVDFVKLNIEGSELPVLLECESLLRNIKFLVLEYHAFPILGDRLHEILSLLHKHNFRYMVHDFDTQTCPMTKPPFSIGKDTQYCLLVAAQKI